MRVLVCILAARSHFHCLAVCTNVVFRGVKLSDTEHNIGTNESLIVVQPIRHKVTEVACDHLLGEAKMHNKEDCFGYRTLYKEAERGWKKHYELTQRSWE